MTAHLNTLKILHWNANGIRSKKHEFFEFLFKNNILVACINETKLNSSLRFNNPDYRVFRLDDEEGQISRGGIAIVVHRSLKCSLLPWVGTRLIQCFGIKILFDGPQRELNILSAYLSGSARTHDYSIYRDDLIKMSRVGQVIALGDFNSRHPFWGCLGHNRAGNVLFDVLNEGHFNIHFPSSPTFYPGPNANPSVLDLVLSNSNMSIGSPEVLTELGSDHLPILLEVFVCHNVEPRRVPCFNKANWALFSRQLENRIDLNFFRLDSNCSFAEIDEKVDSLTNLVVECTNSVVPMIEVRGNNPPLTQELLGLIRLRRSIRRRFVRNGRNPIIRRELEFVSGYINQLFIRRYNLHFQRELEEILPGEDYNRKLFKLARNLRCKRPGCQALKQGDALIISDEEKSNAFASEFNSSFLTTYSSSPRNNLDREVSNSLRNIRSDTSLNLDLHTLTKPSEIKNILKNLNPRKSPGYDGVRNIALKNGGRKFLLALTYIFNACLMLSYFPKAWKFAVMTPIPKPGKPPDSASSYRPISLLSTIGKVFEKVFLKRINTHISDISILPEFQFGFRPGHSTNHQIARVVKLIRENFSKKHSTGMVLLDLKSAFDSVWHDGLVFKMKRANFPTYLVKLVLSFLSERSFAVRVGNSLSAIYPIVAGVPQGACSSPILFNFFLHDIPRMCMVSLAQYADDVAALASSKGPKWVLSRLERYIRMFSKFCNQWRLKINPTKTEAVYFTRRTSNRNLPSRGVRVQDHVVNWSDNAKYLGTYLDKRLTFGKHVDYVKIKGNNCIKALYSVLNRNSRLHVSNKILLYKSIIRPILLYSAQTWGLCAETHLKKVQTFQNGTLKMCLNLPRRFSTNELHNLANVEPIKIFRDNMIFNFTNNCRFSENSLIRQLIP